MRKLDFFNILSFGFATAMVVRCLTYLLFPASTTTQASDLYLLTVNSIGPEFIQVWAVIGLIGIGLAMYGLLRNKIWLGKSGTMVVFVCWAYALGLFITNDLYLQATIAVVLQMLFWGLAYIKLGGAIE